MIAVAIASLLLISGGGHPSAAFADLPEPLLVGRLVGTGQTEQAEWQKLSAEWVELMKKQKYRESLPIGSRVVEVLRKEKPGSAELGDALNTVAFLYERLGQLDDADEVVAEAFSILEGAAGPGTLPIARALSMQGLIAQGKKNLPLAQKKVGGSP